jgi:protein-disulfide isomerase
VPVKRDRLLMLLVPAALLAAAIIAVIVFGSGGGSSGKRVPPNAVSRMLDGIPQHGLVLGSPSAPVTLVEFADLQCPFCGDWERGTLPTIVRKYVRPGKVKIEFRGLHFIGPDSEKALRAVLAAKPQNKLWDLLENLYEKQGTENSGWVTDDLIKRLAGSVPGLDVQRLLAERDSKAVTTEIAQNDQLANSIGVSGTPTFFAGRSNGKLAQVPLTSLKPAGIEPTLDKLLAG